MSPPAKILSSTNNDVYVSPNTQEPIFQKNQVKKIDEESASDSVEDTHASIVVPPDGGWGWVVMIASFCCSVIVDGIIFSFGIFFTDISEEFNVSKAQVSLVGSLLSGFYLITGPFVSALANRFGFRLIAIAGAIIGAGAFVLSSFANSVEFLFISYGILGGIGFGLIYVPAVIAVGFYFERWRALATGIAVCGSGIGTFIFAPLTSTLISYMGWRKTLLVQAATIITCALFGAMFRPIKPLKIAIDSDSVCESDDLKKDVVSPAKIKEIAFLSHDRSRVASTLSLNLNKHQKSNSHYPTAGEFLGKSSATLNNSVLSLQNSKVTKNPKMAMLSRSDKRLSTPVISENIKFALENMESGTKMKDPTACKPLLNENGTKPVSEMERRHTLSEKRARTFSEKSENFEFPRRPSYKRRGTLIGIEIQRPFYRDDIFFNASLNRLPQYTSRTSLGYHMTVTRLASKLDVYEEVEKKSCTFCPEAVKRTLHTMLDLSLLKSPSFLLLAISGFFTMMGFYIPFIYLTDRAHLNGMDIGNAIWLISAIGIANTVGRVLCGVLTSFPGCNALLVNNIAITISGIATLTSGISISDEYQFFYAIIFGLTISCFASLRSVIVVDLVGLERLTNAFGLLLLFQGIAAVIGSPIAGAFMDATGSYDLSFYLSGTLITASALMCYPVNYINNWEKSRNKVVIPASV